MARKSLDAIVAAQKALNAEYDRHSTKLEFLRDRANSLVDGLKESRRKDLDAVKIRYDESVRDIASMYDTLTEEIGTFRVQVEALLRDVRGESNEEGTGTV